MLVLSRKEGEKLVIGDNITVVVSRVSGNRVTLGIEAPADVRIVRGELKAQDKEVHKVVPMRRAATVTIEVESLALDKQAM
jgi:carbon storage regulator CsrA